MKIQRKLWINFISKCIWILESNFFYPKLENAYKELSLTNKNSFPVIFDIGANKGQSIAFFRGLYPTSEIFAFEPSNKIFGILKTQLEKFDENKTFIFRMGIGSKIETRVFYESILDETSTFVLPNSNSLYLRKKNRILLQKPENAFVSVQTQVTTIDNFVGENQIDQIDILKIDVEGFEYEVLLGASTILSRGKIRIIQVERHLDDMHEDTHPTIDTLLTGLGYSKIKEIDHLFGRFSEVLYKKSKIQMD